jgi:carboxymethylenebutenolidase
MLKGCTHLIKVWPEDIAVMHCQEQVVISTAEGQCPACMIKPATTGLWPAVIMYMDAGGMRPAMIKNAEILAKQGYVVLLPDLFYRYGAYGPLNAQEVFKGDVMAVIGPLIATTDNGKVAQDTGLYLDFLDNHPSVKPGKKGAVGFCMGGGMAIASAGKHPDRFAAVASFHGGHLATDTPDSPHRYAPAIAAEVYIASAQDDEMYPPDMRHRFEQVLTDAGVNYRAEAYASSAHGWMVPDFPTYHAEAAQRGWRELQTLLTQNVAG